MIQALDLLVSTPASYGEVVNVGNNHEISILDLAYLVKDRVGSQSEMKFISYKDAYGIQFDDIFHRRPILSKLKQLTGFTPQWTLTETLDFLIQMERKRS
jgi:UDP-glucose 4-epimerase